MADGYGSHADYMSWVEADAAARQKAIEQALREAFSDFIETRQVEVIVFSNVSALDLGRAIKNFPAILKPLVATCNIAGRAIERDLEIKNVDTYNPRLTDEQASAIAGYIKPFLPAYLEIPALVNLDKVSFIDKEISKGKGRWEKQIVESLNKFGSVAFKKRKFEAEGEQFELDAASPQKGVIQIGVDVKRIEARRDIHKRCDEIVNKAFKFKNAYPKAKFAAVIYYPFIDEHINVQNRLKSENIDAVTFAAESIDSIENASRMLLAELGLTK